MLFRKKIARSCEYCSRGTKIDDTTILCVKRGLVTADHSCRKFRYDPCKRIPPKPKALDMTQFDNEDFTL